MRRITALNGIFKKKLPFGELGELLAEEEGLEPPSLTAAVFKTADLPISLFLQGFPRIEKFV